MCLLQDICRNARLTQNRWTLVINTTSETCLSVSAITLNSLRYQLNELMKSFRLCAHEGKPRAASHSPFCLER